MTSPPTLRLAIQQPALPQYRIPVFKHLAQRPGIDLHVYHGETAGLSNTKSNGFNATLQPERRFNIGGQPLYWSNTQWSIAAARYADVAIFSWNTRYLSLVPALLRAKRHGMRTVLWGHGYSKSESGLRWRLRQRVASLADALMFYDRTTANRFIEQGWDPGRIYVAPNALDQQPIQEARQAWIHSDRLVQFQEEQGLTGRDVILYVSRMEPANRLDLLIEALPKLVEQHPSVLVVLIGRSQDDYHEGLQKMAQQLGVADRVRFLGPIYDENQLAPWFLAAKLFCYPANVGLSLLHAFGYGLPIVTSDRREGQNPEIDALAPGENGLTYRDGELDDLIHALGQLLCDPHARQAMAKHAHVTATQQFSLTHMIDGMEAAVRGQVH